MSFENTFPGAIGIDLGTTYSCVGVWEDDSVVILTNKKGNKTTPSWIHLNSNSKSVGEDAKYQDIDSNSFYDIKRLMGRKHSDITNNYPFELTHDDNDNVMIKTHSNKKLYPEQISALIIKEMKEIAEDYLQMNVDKAIVTVPAYFNDSQRQATKNAAKIVGLNCLRILNEPTSACIAYGLDRQEECKKVLVYDFGGGTLDVSLVDLNTGMLDVMATSGNSNLGGEDFDRRIVDKLFNSDLKYKKDAEDIKRKLSFEDVVPYNNEDTLTRIAFVEMCSDLLDQCLEPVETVLRDSKLKKSDIDEIVFVGGTTKMPIVQQKVCDFFNVDYKPPTKLIKPHINNTVNPDEAVAYGAAIMGAILTKTDKSKKTSGLVILNVIPFSMGVETQGGLMNIIVPKNTKVPAKKKNFYTTTKDNQTIITIKVFEGERKLTKDNNYLGTFDLTNLPNRMRGISKIEVTFAIDCDGILNVTAFEMDNQLKKEVTITSDQYGISMMDEDERQLIFDKAEENLKDDIMIANLIECVNRYRDYLLDIKKLVTTTSDYSENLDSNDKEYIISLIDQDLNKLNPNFKNITEKNNFRSIEEINEFKRIFDEMTKSVIDKMYVNDTTNIKVLPDEFTNNDLDIDEINELLAGL